MVPRAGRLTACARFAGRCPGPGRPTEGRPGRKGHLPYLKMRSSVKYRPP